MKLELKHLQGLYEKAQSETVDASKKVGFLHPFEITNEDSNYCIDHFLLPVLVFVIGERIKHSP